MFDTCFGAMFERGYSVILIGRIDHFYKHVCDLLAWSEEKLVRYARGDVDDIAGFDCDPGVAYLVGRRALRVDHCAAVLRSELEMRNASPVFPKAWKAPVMNGILLKSVSD